MNIDSGDAVRRLGLAAVLGFAVLAFVGRVAGSDEPLSAAGVDADGTFAGASIPSVAAGAETSVSARTTPTSQPVPSSQATETAAVTPPEVSSQAELLPDTAPVLSVEPGDDLANGGGEPAPSGPTAIEQLETSLQITPVNERTLEVSATLDPALVGRTIFLVVDDGDGVVALAPSGSSFFGQIRSSAPPTDLAFTLLTCTLPAPPSSTSSEASSAEGDLVGVQPGCQMVSLPGPGTTTGGTVQSQASSSN